VNPVKVASDDFDREYVLIASYFDTLLSCDRKALNCEADLRLLVNEDSATAAVSALHCHLAAMDDGSTP